MRKIIAFAGATVFSLFLWRCTNDNVSPATTPVEISSQISTSTTNFAFGLFNKIHATQPANENVFVSPLSAHMALGMLLNGAEDETANQIKKALKAEGISQADLNEAYQALLKGLPKADPKVQLGLANSVWYRNTFQVQNSFLNVLRQSFDAKVEGLDFANPTAKDKINTWASEQTNGKIKKVIDRIQEQDVLFLLNALYFKGDWKYQFDPAKTSDAPFYLANGQTKTVKMMRIKEKFKAAIKSNYAAVQLPYASGRYNLTLLIPSQGTDVNKLIQGFTAQNWNDLQSTMSEAQVEVGLPRFTLNYEIALNEVLKAMGMTRAFTDNAQLKKINPNEPLYVSLVKQNTYLGIDEKGTEAAAVTTIGVGVTSVGPDPYVCDHPFVLVISEKTSNTILFMGRIMNP
jgi:serine protease inhibitor